MPQMPDTRIAMGGLGGGGQQPQSNAFGTLGQMMQIKEQQSRMQAQQREAEAQQRLIEDDDATRRLVSQSARPDDAVDLLWREGRSSAASKLAQQVYTERKAKSDEYDARLKEHGTRLEQAAQIMQGVNDEASLKLARPAVVELTQPIFGDAINDYIPTTYDKDKINRLIKAGTTRSQQIQADHAMVTEFQNAWAVGMKPDPETGMWSPNGLEARQKYQDALARRLSVAENKDQWDYYRDLAHQYGAPKDVVGAFGPWTDDAKERAMRLGLTIPQEVTAGVAADRAETAQQREERLAAAGGGGGIGETGMRVSKTKRDDDNKDTEEWAREQFTKDNPRPPGVKNSDVRKGAYKAPGFDVTKLSPASQAEFVRKKLTAENNHRSRINMPSLEDAAKKAAASGDADGYEKVRGIFDSLTQGLVKLESIVPPPDEKTTPPASRGASTFPMPGGGGKGGFTMQPQPQGTGGPRAGTNPADAKARTLELLKAKETERDPKKRLAIDQELLGMFGRR